MVAGYEEDGCSRHRAFVMKVVVHRTTVTIGKALVTALIVRHEGLRVSRKRESRAHRGLALDQAAVSRKSSRSTRWCLRGQRRLAAVRPAHRRGLRAPASTAVDVDRSPLVRIGRSSSGTRVRSASPAGVPRATSRCAGGAAISMVPAGAKAFVLGASVEMPQGLRVNVVSPPWISRH